VRKQLKTLGLLVVAGAGAVLAGVMLQPSSPQSAVAESRKSERSAEPAQSRFAALPSREEMGRPQGAPFGSLAPPAQPAVRHMQAAPVAPTPPPMPYRVAGQVVHEGAAHVVLSAGDRVLTVRAGEKLDDGYVVESISADGVTLLYEPLGVRQKLPFTSALGLDAPLAKTALGPAEIPTALAPQAAAGGEPKPARLRWDGPERVRAGDTFDVALRVTSERPVRASPLSLSFDAKLLEPVNVRPGDFFSSGSFNYRINPAGSIFVGALSPGAAAKDAEFLVVTFRPIRAGATAELRLSSFALHGIAGGTIAHDRPADFRAAIQ
jgi:hypothetical protein